LIRVKKPEIRPGWLIKEKPIKAAFRKKGKPPFYFNFFTFRPSGEAIVIFRAWTDGRI
jgi:hypothetical protein